MHLKCRVRRRVTASSSFRLVYDKMMFGGKQIRHIDFCENYISNFKEMDLKK